MSQTSDDWLRFIPEPKERAVETPPPPPPRRKIKPPSKIDWLMKAASEVPDPRARSLARKIKGNKWVHPNTINELALLCKMQGKKTGHVPRNEKLWFGWGQFEPTNWVRNFPEERQLGRRFLEICLILEIPPEAWERRGGLKKHLRRLRVDKIQNEDNEEDFAVSEKDFAVSEKDFAVSERETLGDLYTEAQDEVAWYNYVHNLHNCKCRIGDWVQWDTRKMEIDTELFDEIEEERPSIVPGQYIDPGVTHGDTRWSRLREADQEILNERGKWVHKKQFPIYVTRANRLVFPDGFKTEGPWVWVPASFLF